MLNVLFMFLTHLFKFELRILHWKYGHRRKKMTKVFSYILKYFSFTFFVYIVVVLSFLLLPVPHLFSNTLCVWLSVRFSRCLCISLYRCVCICVTAECVSLRRVVFLSLFYGQFVLVIYLQFLSLDFQKLL